MDARRNNTRSTRLPTVRSQGVFPSLDPGLSPVHQHQSLLQDTSQRRKRAWHPADWTGKLEVERFLTPALSLFVIISSPKILKTIVRASGRSAVSDDPACGVLHHPGSSPAANPKSISHRCYLREVAFEWELTKEIIYLLLGCLQGGSRFWES